MKRVIFKFTDGSHVNLPADFIDLKDGIVSAWDGNNLVAVAKIDAVEVCYLSEKKEQEG